MSSCALFIPQLDCGLKENMDFAFATADPQSLERLL